MILRGTNMGKFLLSLMDSCSPQPSYLHRIFFSESQGNYDWANMASLLNFFFFFNFSIDSWMWEWSGFLICHPLIIKFNIVYWAEFMFFSKILSLLSSKIRERKKWKIRQQRRQMSFSLFPMASGQSILVMETASKLHYWNKIQVLNLSDFYGLGL